MNGKMGSHESSRINTNVEGNIDFSSMQAFFISVCGDGKTHQWACPSAKPEGSKARKGELRVLCGKKKTLKGAPDPTQEQTEEQGQRCR